MKTFLVAVTREGRTMVEHLKAPDIAVLALQYIGSSFLKMEEVATCDIFAKEKAADCFGCPGFIGVAHCCADCAERQLREGILYYRRDVNSHSVLKEKLDAVLTSITERERAILEMRFGLVDGRGHTLEEIGNDPFTKSSTGKSRISI